MVLLFWGGGPPVRLGYPGPVIAISPQRAYLAKRLLRHFDGAEHGCAQASEWFFRRDERCLLSGGNMVNEEEMAKRLAALRIEHRDLDAAIDALRSADSVDQLQIARLKKRKLKLKDQIALIQDYLIPDIIA